MYFLRLYNGQSLYETIGGIGTLGLCISDWKSRARGVSRLWIIKFIINELVVLTSLYLFQYLGFDFDSTIFLTNWYGPVFMWSIYFFKQSSRLIVTVDLPLSAGKTTIDVSGCNSFKTLRSFLERLFLESLKCKADFSTNRITLIFSLNMSHIIIYITWWWENIS